MAPAGAKAAPPGSGIPPKPQSIPPNQTLYVRGIPSAKIQKDDLRTALYLLFSTYGPVLDVVALKTHSMRGQAHIVYRDIQTATQAMRALDGFNFLGYEMVRCLSAIYDLCALGMMLICTIESSVRQDQVKRCRETRRDLQNPDVRQPTGGNDRPTAKHIQRTTSWLSRAGCSTCAVRSAHKATRCSWPDDSQRGRRREPRAEAATGGGG